MSPKGKVFTIGSLKVGRGAPLFLIAGPCVIESEAVNFKVARGLKKLYKALSLKEADNE